MTCGSIGLSISTAQFTHSFLGPRTITIAWTWWFRQSTLVTIPVMVVALVSSNFAATEWWARPGAPASTNRASTAASTPVTNLIANPPRCPGLLALDPERAAAALALPGAGDEPVVHRQVFNLSLDYVGNRALLVLGISLEAHRPLVGIERRVLERHVVGAGI